ncbi:hypothetical protein BCEN4_440063 [Burkholderia cenocepacia]|nr:hypothetical protein BCEN4_440063 [Burkholderia cenocepacia]
MMMNCWKKWCGTTRRCVRPERRLSNLFILESWTMVTALRFGLGIRPF